MAGLEPGARGLEHLRFAGWRRQFPRAPRTLARSQQALGVGNGGDPDILLRQRVRHAGLQCLGRAYRFAARSHVQRLLDARQAQQPRNATRPGDDAQGGLGQAQAGLRIHHPVVAAQGQFQPPAQRGTVDRRDHGLGAGLDGVDHLRQVRVQRRLAELLDVGAGHEGGAGAGDDDGLGIVIARRLLHGLQQAGAHRLGRGVDRRIVDDDDADVSAKRGSYGLHGCPGVMAASPPVFSAIPAAAPWPS